MSREWAAGDVAVVNRHAALRLAYSVFTCPSTHRSAGDHWHLADGHWAHDDSTGARHARPLVVIDPEDREQAGRLLGMYTECVHSPVRGEDEPDDWRTDRMQAALREFANPTPPKPAEPTGLGAVVEDADGAKWIRSDDTDCANPWHQNGTFTDREYAEIDAVRVLSEGVLPGVEPLADWEIDLLRGAR